MGRFFNDNLIPKEETMCKLGNPDIGWGKCSWHMENGECSLKKCKCDWDDRDTFDIAKEENEEIEDDRIPITAMRCPRCGEPLSYNGKRSFVTLSEHVSCCENDPKWNPPLRHTWHCVYCREVFNEAFYDDSGEMYGGDMKVPHRYWDALNSWAWDTFFVVNAQMQETNPGYDEDLKQEKLKLPDCPKVK